MSRPLDSIKQVKDEVRELVWNKARELDWSLVPDAQKARYYERWTKDPAIGGRLAYYMDPRSVRVYIKDTILKSFEREKLSEGEEALLRLFEISSVDVVEEYIKPHGKRFANGRILSWGNSRDWKTIITASFERSWGHSDAISLVGLFETGQTLDDDKRQMLRELAERIGIRDLRWAE